MRHTTTARAKLTGPTTAIILAAEHLGRPNRSLYKLNGESIIDCQIRTIKEVYPVCEVVVITGHDGERLLDSAAKFVENERFADTNTVRDICLALRVASYQNLLIVPNNLWFDRTAIDIFSNESRVLVKSEKNKSAVGCIIQDSVLNFVYGAEPRWEEIAFISYKDMPLLRDFCAAKKNERMFLHEALNEIVSKVRILPIEQGEVKKYDVPRHIPT